MIERWRNSHHYFSLPGGKIEQDENAQAAVERETTEETSVIVQAIRPVYRYEQKNSNLVHEIWLCNYISGSPLLPHDVEEAAVASDTNVYKPIWLKLSDVSNVPLWPSAMAARLLHDKRRDWPEFVVFKGTR